MHSIIPHLIQFIFVALLQSEHIQAKKIFTLNSIVPTQIQSRSWSRSLANSSTYSASITSSSRSQSSDQKPEEFDKQLFNCKPAPDSQCKLCLGGARSGHEGCEETGKRQEFYCDRNSDNDDEGSTDGSEPIEYFFSCKRTRVEEEYLIMRLQGICALVAFLSLRNVRREKLLSESLFDNRKRVARQHQMSQEMQQEMIPLAPATGGRSNDYDEETGEFSSFVGN